MSTGALYRKYRSKTFDEVIGQEHITTTLTNSINNNSFAHAYLFTGPRGVGKTSVARLFAFKINGLKYDEKETYSDIIEIDAASNRRIDEIRELREKVNISPSSLKYKVYIVDEVHMLTKEAFNALLKTLEEPPDHVVFILATTDFHKVPDTITSRCIRFAFQAIPASKIKEHLKKIAKKESLQIEDGAIELIADNSEGSFRDAISLLDQFRNSKKIIKTDYVSKILGLSPDKEIAELVSYVALSKPQKVVESLDRLRSTGAVDSQIIKQLVAYMRSCLIAENKSGLSHSALISIMKSLLEANEYPNMSLALEVALLEAINDDKKPFVEETEQTPKNSTLDIDSPAVSEHKTKQQNGTIISDKLWQSALNNLKSTNSALYSVIRMAEPRRKGNILELYFKFPFHYKKMGLEKNYLPLKETVQSLDESISDVKLYLSEKSESPEVKKVQKKRFSETVDNISNIFGPSEVLES